MRARRGAPHRRPAARPPVAGVASAALAGWLARGGSLAAAGWPLAVAAAGVAVRLRWRLELVARAEHELRGPATVVALAAERLGGDPAARRHAALLEAEVARLRAALGDLAAARRGRRSASRRAQVDVGRLAGSALAGWRGTLERAGRRARFRWSGPGAAEVDPGRVGQALANLVANAVEHGSGDVEVSGRRSPGGLRVEVRNRVGGAGSGAQRADAAGPERGRGLAIATEAARAEGGTLELAADGRGTVVAALELPAARAAGRGGAAEPPP